MQKILPITRVHIEEGPSDIENQEEQVEEELRRRRGSGF